jgi:hypothetical protein
MEEFSIREALKNASSNEQSRWPGRESGNRLEPFCWPSLRPGFKLRQGATVFTIGSCFARSIENYLDNLGFSLPTLSFMRANPDLFAGSDSNVLNRYTPPSIYQELAWVRAILDRDDQVRMKDVEPLLLDAGKGLVHDLMRVPVQEFGIAPEHALGQRRLLYSMFKSAFNCDAVVITLGLIECWWDQEREVFVEYNRTLLRHPERFVFRRLDYPVALDYVQKAVNLINRDAPNHILITTSPVPLNRTFMKDDVIVANTYSKCLLRCVAEVIRSTNERVDYFPSFESVMLSRDTSVWMDDLIHVQPAFVGSIMLRVTDAYVGKSTDATVIDSMYAFIRFTNDRNWDDALRTWLGIDHSKTPATPEEFYICGAELGARSKNLHAVRALVGRVGSRVDSDGQLRCANALEAVGCMDLGEERRKMALGQVNHNHTRLWDWLSLLRMSGRTDDITWLLGQAEGIIGGDSNALCQLAYYVQTYGTIERAEELYREVLRLAPQHEEASLRLAYLLFDRDRTPEGMNLLENVAKNGSESEYLFPLGKEWLRQGRRSEAKSLIDRLVAANPDHIGLRQMY